MPSIPPPPIPENPKSSNRLRQYLREKNILALTTIAQEVAEAVAADEYQLAALQLETLSQLVEATRRMCEFLDQHPPREFR